MKTCSAHNYPGGYDFNCAGCIEANRDAAGLVQPALLVVNKTAAAGPTETPPIALPMVAGGWNIVYADPPWSYDDKLGNRASMGGFSYPTMTEVQLKAMPVKDIVAKDAALFMWVTMPMLPLAFGIGEAWGFRYITCAFVWVKQNPSGQGIYSGIGRWVNGNAELCLMFKRGRPERMAKNVKQIVLAPRGRHSAKPPEVRDRIVSLMGDKPRLELFARERAAGWDAWGNEV